MASDRGRPPTPRADRPAYNRPRIPGPPGPPEEPSPHADSHRVVHRRAPAEWPAPGDRRGPSRARRGGQHLVQRRLEERGRGQNRLCPPVRARDVPGFAERREGGAHRPRPGGRRDDERHDLARPDELLPDGPVAPTGARALARGRPDGNAPRCPEPGEPRQPARGREEREALVVRQPPLRLVEREDPGPPVPARAPLPP